jgi:hypothetical protein
MSMWMIFLKVAGGSVGCGRGEFHREFHGAGIFNQVARKIDTGEVFWQRSGAFAHRPWPK